jgi:hypothetical protein
MSEKMILRWLILNKREVCGGPARQRGDGPDIDVKSVCTTWTIDQVMNGLNSMQETSSHDIAEPHLGLACSPPPPKEVGLCVVPVVPQWWRPDRDLGLEIGMRSNPRQLHPSILYLYLMIILILIGCVVLFVVPARYTFIFSFHVLEKTGKHSIFKKSVSNERFSCGASASEPVLRLKRDNGIFFLWLYKQYCYATTHHLFKLEIAPIPITLRK